MGLKTVLIFLAAAGLSLLAAHHRFLDAAHSIGLIKAGGGKARHPVVFEPGYDRYTLITTAAVIPPYRGDARVVLEGLPGMDYALFSSGPALDLSPYRHPEFRHDTFYGLQPRDRIALWVVMRPRPGWEAPEGGRPDAAPAGSDCCAVGGEHAHGEAPATSESAPALAFYDLKSGQRLLDVPIHFGAPGGHHGSAH